MGFLGGLLKTAVKTALLLAAVVADAAEVIQGKPCENTGNLLDNVIDTAGEAFDDLTDGDFL